MALTEEMFKNKKTTFLNPDIKEVLVRTSDGIKVKIGYILAAEMGTLVEMINELNYDSGDIIPLSNVRGEILRAALDWIKYGKDTESEDAETIYDFNQDFVRGFFEKDNSFIIEILQAANFLNIVTLRKGACRALGNLLKAKTPDEIRSTFDIPDDLSSDELRRMLEESGGFSYET
ncbi:E3 ubiquitin ligase complex SCF subunit sconC-like [Teleopsis dalmanni]|uniref:E3 ubiquitin ligase complex SCF subunit sconC-like n=1 Tax=Teleopsis dalmanni TaxID=139649 RepID=UPI0018CD57D0|nr:E3 ubiquitin ligase complex SCF subunit sconC-like [Teleopsis dalmanni]